MVKGLEVDFPDYTRGRPWTVHFSFSDATALFQTHRLDDLSVHGFHTQQHSHAFTLQTLARTANPRSMPALPLTGLNVLVVEDEPLLRKHLSATLERLGADVTSTDTLSGARQLAASLNYDFVLLDIQLPDGSGLDLLRQKEFGANTGVVVMTVDSGIAKAVEAMKLGALDFLAKPFEPEALALALARGRKTRAAERVEEHRRRDVSETAFFFGAALSELEAQLQRLIQADRRLQSSLPPVLIQGETGTGKTTVARWLHQSGPRANGPMVEMNCSAIPETLAESELFGHEKGAFTDARATRLGLLEAAHGGTLFLDELASLSPSVQAKLLTALEDRRIRRVGGQKEIPVDVRVIAAANRDLKQLVAEGRMREDLYHRLDLYRITIPPLRQRGDDIIRLAETLIVRVSRRHRLSPKPISVIGRRRLLTYAWPGNVRELAHEVERALVFDDSPELNFDQLIGAGGSATHPLGGVTSADADWFNEKFQFPETGFSLEDAILRLIHHALAQAKGNVSGAARILGVSRDYLRYRLAPSREKGGDSSEAGPPE